MSFEKLTLDPFATGVFCAPGADVLAAAAALAGACVLCGADVAGTTFSVACEASV